MRGAWASSRPRGSSTGKGPSLVVLCHPDTVPSLSPNVLFRDGALLRRRATLLRAVSWALTSLRSDSGSKSFCRGGRRPVLPESLCRSTSPVPLTDVNCLGSGSVVLNRDHLLQPPVRIEATCGCQAHGSAGGCAQRALSGRLWWDALGDGFRTLHWAACTRCFGRSRLLDTCQRAVLLLGDARRRVPPPGDRRSSERHPPSAPPSLFLFSCPPLCT